MTLVLKCIVYGYIVAGHSKGLQLAEQLKRDIEEYDYYLSLSKYEQKYVKKVEWSQPILYSLIKQE